MKITTLSLLILLSYLAHANDSTSKVIPFVYNAITTNEKIKIDGVLDESIWQSIKPLEFTQEHWPQNGRLPLNKTEAMITRDENFMYVAFRCHDTNDKYIIQTLKRDFEFDQNDFVSILFDPLGQKNSAYIFGVSPAGVQAEAIANRFDVDPNWDNKWFSAVKSHADHWIAEFAIPLYILRYDPNLSNWNLNLIRGDVKNYRFYTWVKIPQQYDGIDLGYLGKLEWDQQLPSKGGKITAIPYVNLTNNKDFKSVSKSTNDLGIGGDAKITLSSSLNLDLTINPDFSQVEVDRQVTNLTRFNVFFPERRNFFLENADLFSQFGDPESPIFFSRRIGLDEDRNAVPILGGARLTGNMGDKWRIGALSMQTKATSGQTGQNYSAFTLHRKIWSRSVVKALVTNRQGMQSGEFSKTDYGRNVSTEFVYQTPGGKLLSWLGLHQSYKKQFKNDRAMFSSGVWYNSKKFNTVNGIGYIGTNYTADMGFINQLDNYDAVRDTVIKQGFANFFNSTDYTFWTPDNKILNYHKLSFNSFGKYIPGKYINEWNNKLVYNLSFKSSAEISLSGNQNFARLLFPFSFTEDDEPLPEGNYHYTNFNVQFNSDVRKPFGIKLESTVGGFYNGTIKSAVIGFKYRRQPWGNFQMNFEYNDLQFPGIYGRAQFLLINPKLEFNFNRNLYWTTFLQYNTQADNFNINSRLQWRYKPMSDIFLVYTDNYAVQFWGPKNRSLVVKVNYWLNL